MKQKNKMFNIDFSKKRKLTDIKGMLTEIKYNKKTDVTYIITMFMRNGTRSHFLIFPDTDSFLYNKKRYIIDENYKYYDNTTRNWGLTYHEDLSLPVKIDIQAIKKKSKLEEEASEVSTAINPESLEIYMKSSFIQKIMRGEEMDKIFKRLILLGTVTTIGVVIHLLLYLQQSGALSGLGF